MFAQNLNLFKPIKSISPPQIQIYQPACLLPLNPPLLNKEAAQPLNLTYQQIKNNFQKPTSIHIKTQHYHQQITPPNQTKSHATGQVEVLRQQNQQLKKNLLDMTNSYQEQRQKYNDLKNLYKEGEAMFEMLEQKKIMFEKENKELKEILEKLYNDLHHQNYNFQEIQKNRQNKYLPNKIQKVKIGNKKIPVIKVNVPPQTFIKKQHEHSVCSQNSEQDGELINKQELQLLKQQIQRLHETNLNLGKELKEVKLQVENKQKIIENLKSEENKAIRVQELSILKTDNRGAKSSFGSNERTYQSEVYPVPLPSSYVGNSEADSINFYKNKYSFLETELNRKDETLKKLYNQCFLLQTQINQLKSQQSPNLHNTNQPNKQSLIHPDQTKSLNFPQPESTKPITKKHEGLFKDHEAKEQKFYIDKISELQKRLNELNQVCISNVNQTFRINELNDTISKITRENSLYKEKINSQESELARLYKILENKNTELSEIYSTVTESKRFDATKKKSLENVFTNTPQKGDSSSKINFFYSNGITKEFPSGF